MIRRSLSAFGVMAVIFVFSCSSSSVNTSRSLVDDIYNYARNGNVRDSITAFIALSNIALKEVEIKRIEYDYSQVTDEKTKYYYEYLLAKRTQEEKYIESFLKDSKKNLSSLIENNSQWISIGSPFYELLSFYSKTNDEALSIQMQLVDLADGAPLSMIIYDLLDARKLDPTRFSRVLKYTGIKEKNLLKLMEDE